ncbi:serum amyloid A [Xiphophorus hellerii]|uniref:serum amyloid A n=1 Tax=Xiphophorus hellerii TaxID=8084 RepID=UPI0013B3DB6F|nr:serum amyloid A-5 protein-like [Xiphophorus hellerii]XP_032415671.1 serum amyloid A-5 protein-like [Xiphophorus hellerii]XP_032415672.1 serum amyloid A-5 protein-like [Xiphophorus hellerii]XP_032415673.1 serum amyloid A-5 protein-like [Xiphophorus hellerii]
MKLLLAGIVLISIIGTEAQWYYFPIEAAKGTFDMGHAYVHMRQANCINGDKYYHARGNSRAAKRGNGGEWAAEVISDAREWMQKKTGRGAEDSEADQEANQWGRNGGDPNRYRVNCIPDDH